MTPEQAARLEAHRKTKIAAEEAAQERADLHELAMADLEEELSKSGLKKGLDFELVETTHGAFAVRKPDARGIKAWEGSTDKQKGQLEWMIAFLRHYIAPEAKLTEWMTLCGERPGVCWATANAFLVVYGVEVELLQKKR